MHKTAKIHKEIAELAYSNYKIGEVVQTKSSFKIGEVIDFNNDRSGNGEYIYTIVNDGPIVVFSAPIDERIKVKEITIIYRGSANPFGIILGNAKKVRRDWIENNIALFMKRLTKKKGLTGQLKVSADYLNEIMEKYPKAKINLYGHSLGSMNVQCALSCVTDYSRIKCAYIYNGPNIYEFLSFNQKVMVSVLYPKIHNFIDSNDIIGMWYEEGKGAVGQIYKFRGLDKKTIPTILGSVLLGGFGGLAARGYGSFSVQHLWGGYNFNENGNLLDKDGKKVIPWQKSEETAQLEKLLKK